MATLKIVVKKDKMRADGTWNVLIRLTHKRRVKYIPTTEYVTKKDITPSFRIKNTAILDRCEDVMTIYRKRLRELELEVTDFDIDFIVRYITERKGSSTSLSFTEYAEEWMRKSSIKGLKNYKTAVNAFVRYMGHPNVMMSEMSTNVMNGFVESLSDKPRAASLYSNAIMKIFNDAREHYNDEDNDVVIIKQSLSKFKAPRQNAAKKRALPLDVIRMIFSLPYDGIRVKGYISRHDLALGCFRLSFCLMGMNVADMFTASKTDGNTIVYNRQKTKDRRADMAEMRIDVQECVKPLFDKYRGDDNHVFSFFRRFSSSASLTRAINIGLEQVTEEINAELASAGKSPIGKIQFYSARHSFATIAINDVGIDKWTVNEMLCHTDPSMRVTDLYIRKDFRPINEANKKLLEFLNIKTC